MSAPIWWPAPCQIKQLIFGHWLVQGFSTLALKVHFPAEFSSNPNQTHLNKLIKLFRITRKWLGMFDGVWPIYRKSDSRTYSREHILDWIAPAVLWCHTTIGLLRSTSSQTHLLVDESEKRLELNSAGKRTSRARVENPWFIFLWVKLSNYTGFLSYAVNFYSISVVLV